MHNSWKQKPTKTMSIMIQTNINDANVRIMLHLQLVNSFVKILHKRLIMIILNKINK